MIRCGLQKYPGQNIYPIKKPEKHYFIVCALPNECQLIIHYLYIVFKKKSNGIT